MKVVVVAGGGETDVYACVSRCLDSGTTRVCIAGPGDPECLSGHRSQIIRASERESGRPMRAL